MSTVEAANCDNWPGAAGIQARSEAATRLDMRVGAVLLCLVAAFAAARFTLGFQPVISDFTQLYVSGTAFRQGVMPYGSFVQMNDTPGGADTVLGVYYYPPVVGAIFALPSLLPYVLADVLWLAAIVFVLGSAIWRMARLVWPQAHVIVPALITLVTLMGSGARWNLVNHQPSTMIIGLLIHFGVSTSKNKNNRSLALALAISLKPTYLIPVIGLFLYDRDYRKIGIVFAAAVVLSLVAAAPSGFVDTLNGYATVTRGLLNGSINHGTAIDSMGPYLVTHPESPLVSLMSRDAMSITYIDQLIHADFIASAWAPTAAGTGIVSKLIIIVGLVAAFAVGRKLRAQEPEQESDQRFALFAMLAALSLLIGYHNRYDLLALAPAGFVAARALSTNRFSVAGWLGMGAALLACWLLSSRLVSMWVETVVGKSGLLPLLPICGYLVVACFIACALLLVKKNALMQPRALDGTAELV